MANQIRRPFYGITVEYFKENPNTFGNYNIDLTRFVNNLTIYKTIRGLFPFIYLSFAPDVRQVLKSEIDDMARFVIRVYRYLDSTNKDSPIQVFEGEVFINTFRMNYFKKGDSEATKAGLQERVPLEFECYPTYMNKLYRYAPNMVWDSTDASLDDLVSFIIEKTWKDDFSIFRHKLENKYKFQTDKFLIHKTPALDYLRYLSQRFGFYKTTALFFTDFPDIRKANNTINQFVSTGIEGMPVFGTTGGIGGPGLNEINQAVSETLKPRLFFWSFAKALKEPPVATLMLARSDELKDRPKKKDTIYVLTDFGELLETPSKLLSTKTTVNFYVENRNHLFNVDKRAFEGPMEEMVRTREEEIKVPDYLKIEKPFLTNSVDFSEYGKNFNQKVKDDPTYFEANYYGDGYTMLRTLKVTPHFFTPWKYIEHLGLPMYVDTTVPEFSKRIIGTYLLTSVKLNFIRQSGGDDVWQMRQELEISRQ